MNSLTLPNGHEFSKYYGGSLKKLENISDRFRHRFSGDFCTVRQYRQLHWFSVNGVNWAQVQQDKVKDYESYSPCGYFKIVNYGNNPQFGLLQGYKVYQCTTWRENLGSTFGNHHPQIGATKFKTFEEAAIAVSNVKPIGSFR